MDPLTILTVAGMAFTAGQKAYEAGVALGEFINDVKHIDQTIGLLVNEVKSLSAACELVGTRIKGIAEAMDGIKQESKKESPLWMQVKSQLEDCSETIMALYDAVKDAGLERKKNPFSQAWRQIQLNMKAKDIDEARNRIRSHTASLQLVLQAITLELSYLAPHRADQQLLVLLENIKDIKKELSEMRHSAQDLEVSDTERRHEQKEDELIQYTDRIISSGETLYEGSIAGGSVIGNTEGLDEKITSWVSRLQVLSSDTATSLPEEYGAASSVSGADIGTATDLTSESGIERPDDLQDSLDDDDEGDDLEVEMIKEAYELGQSEFQAKEYTKANMLLQEVLTMVEESPMRSGRILNTRELQWMLAVCAYHTGDYSTAEAALKVIVQTPPQGQDDRIRLCDAGHILALAALKQDKLAEARQYCDSALQGRRRLLGKQDPACYESLALLARIFELQDNSARAAIYARMIPEEERDKVCAEFKSIGTTPALVGEKKAATEKELPPLPPGPPPYIPTSPAEPSSATSATSSEQRWRAPPPIPIARPVPDLAPSYVSNAPESDDEDPVFPATMTDEVSRIINGEKPIAEASAPKAVVRTATWSESSKSAHENTLARAKTNVDALPAATITDAQRQEVELGVKITTYQDEVTRAQRRYGKKSPPTQAAVQRYAAAVHEMDLKRPSAETQHKDVLKQLKSSVDADHPLVYVTYANLAKIAENNGDFNKSSDYYQKVLDGMKKAPAEDSAAAFPPPPVANVDKPPEVSYSALKGELRALRKTYRHGTEATDVAKRLRELRLALQQKR